MSKGFTNARIEVGLSFWNSLQSDGADTIDSFKYGFIKDTSEHLGGINSHLLQAAQTGRFTPVIRIGKRRVVTS